MAKKKAVVTDKKVKKRRKSSPSKLLAKKIVILYSKIVCCLWQGRCALCGRVGTQAHHFFTKKAHPSVVYETEHGCWLCFSCHIRRVHQAGDSEALRDILIAKIGQERFDKIKDHAYNGLNRYRENDLELLYQEMSERLKKLTQQKGKNPHSL